MRGLQIDWADVVFKYDIGQTVYTVFNPGANKDIETEPHIAEWMIDGVGVDKNRRPMYHLVPPEDAPVWRFIMGQHWFAPEGELLLDTEAAKRKKAEMWRENIAVVNKPEVQKLEEFERGIKEGVDD